MQIQYKLKIPNLIDYLDVDYKGDKSDKKS
jgi:hypothetical protein